MLTSEQRARYRKNEKIRRLKLKTQEGQREFQGKKFANVMKKKYQGFNFRCDGITTSIEVNLPFRCMTFLNSQKRVDEKMYYEIQKDLKKRIGSVFTKNHIVVVEPEYAQVVLLGMEQVDEVMNKLIQWGREKTEEFGVYMKNNKLLNNWFK